MNEGIFVNQNADQVQIVAQAIYYINCERFQRVVANKEVPSNANKFLYLSLWKFASSI